MKRTVKICIPFILIFIIIFGNKLVFSHNKVEDKEKPSFNLLVINSYHQGHYWESFVLDGLENSLNKNEDYNINIKIEYLDFRNRHDEVYQKSFKSFLENKYRKEDIDIICAINDESYNFIKDDILDKNSMFYQIPFVFCGVNQELIYEEQDSNNIIGLDDPADTFKLVSLMKNLLPGIDNLNLIVEDSEYGNATVAEIEDVINVYSKKPMEITYIKGDYIEDITEQLIALSYKPNSANIVAGEFQYKNSEIFLNPKDTIKEIREYNNFPIFSNDQTYLNAGIVGGCVDIGQEHGKQAAELILKSISGEDLSKVYSKPQPEPKIHLDYEGIYEYGIDPMRVGSETIIFNKNFYQLLLPKEAKRTVFIIFCLIGTCIILEIRRVIKKRKIFLKEKENQKIKEDREKLKSDFIVNLSHELRTPINIILNTAKVINLKIKPDNIDKKDIEEKLDIISNSSYRLLKISNNIIDLTNSESGLFKLSKKNENIVVIVEDAFMASIEFAKSKSIEMTFNTDEEEIITGIDKIQIQRVVLNLVSNAIKYTNIGGHINVEMYIVEDNVEILVKDTGIGIPTSKIDEIFYRFYQVDYSIQRENEGSGMGLCIVKDIVEYHNGKINVESNVGEGSIFKVFIPIKLVDDNINDENIGYDITTIAKVEMSDVNK